MKIVGTCQNCGGNMIEDIEDGGSYCLQCNRHLYDEPLKPWVQPRRLQRREGAIGSDHVGDRGQRKRENAREGLE